MPLPPGEMDPSEDSMRVSILRTPYLVLHQRQTRADVEILGSLAALDEFARAAHILLRKGLNQLHVYSIRSTEE